MILDEFLQSAARSGRSTSSTRCCATTPTRPAKGMRALMCVSACKAFGGSEDEVLLTAACIEIFQHWILIHDDIEDDSELRRGSPALHKKYDWRLALNAGDALHAIMWGALLRNRKQAQRREDAQGHGGVLHHGQQDHGGAAHRAGVGRRRTGGTSPRRTTSRCA